MDMVFIHQLLRLTLLAFHFFFEIGSLIKPGVSDSSRLAGQRALGSTRLSQNLVAQSGFYVCAGV